MRPNVAVVIPAYRETLEPHEAVSLRQINTVLKAHPRFLILPEGEKPGYADPRENTPVFFKKEFFSDIHGYNELLLSTGFYERFKNFEYILIAQLDSFVFSDELDRWCAKQYDYAGAPWVFEVSQYAYTREHLPVLHRYPFLKKLRRFFGQDFLAGNGGFSLRKVGTFLKILKDHSDKVNRFRKNGARLLARGVATAGHEDNFWGLQVPRFYRKFKIPLFKEALKFSFEVNPSYSYERNGNALPFGCHGWPKHDPDFWKPMIRRYGHEI